MIYKFYKISFLISKPDGFHSDKSFVNSNIIRWARSENMYIFLFTVNDKEEFENFKKPETWLKNCLNRSVNLKKIFKINFNISEQESLIMGLRLNKGVNLNKIQNKSFLNNNEILKLQSQGIINIKKNYLSINENYFNVHDYIVRKIIDNYLSS